MPKVYNKYHKDAPKDAVYIGRPGPWGNPFSIGADGTRSEVVALYSDLVDQSPGFKEDIKRNLRGKDLVCFCAPSPCHGDILLKVANEEDS